MKRMQSEFYRLEQENGYTLVVKKDDSKHIDSISDLGLLGEIIGFDDEGFRITNESKSLIKSLLKESNKYFAIPLFFTEKGIHTQEKLIERLSGCIYISFDEIRKVYNNYPEINDDVMDLVTLELLSTIDMYEKFILNQVYKYELYDQQSMLISETGSFYDLEQCVDAGKQEITTIRENKV